MTAYLRFTAFLLLISLSFASCRKTNMCRNSTDCINQKIKEIKSQSPSKCQVWQWKADGKVYYYVTSACCDNFNYLYDDKCNIVCAPDGGFSGGGDGKCPKFTCEVEKTLIWQDDRQ